MKTLVKNILFAGLVGASALAYKYDIHQLYELVYFSPKTIEIKKGNTYWKETQKLRKQYPRLGKIDPRVLCYYLEKSLNDGKKLKSGFPMRTLFRS